MEDASYRHVSVPALGLSLTMGRRLKKRNTADSAIPARKKIHRIQSTGMMHSMLTGKKGLTLFQLDPFQL